MIAHQFHTVDILFFALFMQLAQLYMYKDSRNLWICIINNFMYSYVILCVHVCQFVVITTKPKFLIIVSLIKHYQFLWPSDLPFQTQCSCAPQTYRIQQMILGRTVTWSFPLQSTFPVFKATTWCWVKVNSRGIEWFLEKCGYRKFWPDLGPLFMNDRQKTKGRKVRVVNVMNLLQKSIYFRNIFFFRKNIWVLLELVCSRTQSLP